MKRTKPATMVLGDQFDAISTAATMVITAAKPRSSVRKSKQIPTLKYIFQVAIATGRVG